MYKLNFGCLATCIPYSVCYFMLVSMVPFRKWVILLSVEVGNKNIPECELGISDCYLLSYPAGSYKILSSMMISRIKIPNENKINIATLFLFCSIFYSPVDSHWDTGQWGAKKLLSIQFLSNYLTPCTDIIKSAFR